MRRIVVMTCICLAVMIFAFARPVSASNRYWATGVDVRINLVVHCGEDFTYPANTPFNIAHGWIEGPWAMDLPANKQAFMGLATYFEFRIDRVPQSSTMLAIYLPSPDLKLKLFVSESDQGLTGIHRLAGVWFIDGELIGETPGEPVFAGACVSNVAFV